MSSPLENPAIRYGLPISSAMIVAFIAFVFLDGTIRQVVLSIALFEIVVLPKILKLVAKTSAGVA